MDIAPKNARKRIARDLVSKLEADNNHLRTGFVGTPYLCRVLSEAGYDDMAYSLFLTRDYPGWLYAVSMGATTIWERWNSVKPDHSVGDAGMNSLNHYAYGSIFEWVYRYAAGLNPVADAPGFKKALIAPRPDRRLGKLSLAFESPMGRYQIKWAYQDTCFKMEVEIPFGAQAQICLPHVMPGTVMLNGTALEGGEMNGDALCLTKGAGTYTFAYSLSRE
jgi:alpha-L-rhamnosidase